MIPDENREWYVYHNEKEMGPVLESQLKIRLQGGELDSSAFVFTEGMSDWTAIEEVKIFTESGGDSQGAAQELSSSEMTPSELSAPGHETPHQSIGAFGAMGNGSRQEEELKFMEQGGVSEATDYPEQLDDASIVDLHSHKSLSVETLGASDAGQEAPEFLRESEKTSSPEKAKSSKGLKWLRWSFIGVVSLAAVGAFVDYMAVTSAGRPEFLKLILGEPSVFSAGESEAAAQDTEAAPVNEPIGQVQSSKADLIWAELFAVRSSTDPKGIPFRLSSDMFSPERPILTGALSGLIQASAIHLVIYPDLSQNLMNEPRVWWLSVPVVDGYFTAGPLSIEGAPLPVGIYRVMVQAEGKYLGEVSFEVGEFPTGPELAVAQKDLQNTYLMAASKELERLEESFRSFEALFEALRQNSAKFALKGKARRAAWNKSKVEWNEAFDKTALKFNEGAALTYYPEVQSKMAEYSRELLRVLGLMDLYNQSGRLAFEKRAGARYSDVWNALKKDKDFLKAEVSNLEGQKIMAPTIDRDLLKADLLNLR